MPDETPKQTHATAPPGSNAEKPASKDILPQDKPEDMTFKTEIPVSPNQEKKPEKSVTKLEDMVNKVKEAQQAKTGQTEPSKATEKTVTMPESKKEDKNTLKAPVSPKETVTKKQDDKEPTKASAEKESSKQDKAAQKPEKSEKSEKTAPTDRAKKPEKSPKAPTPSKSAPEAKAPIQPETPPAPAEAPRPGKDEQIVYLKLSDLHAFKNHPFQVRNDEEMKAMVSSVKDKGVTQPAIVRPLEGGGYEIVSGHRRQKASELAGFTDMPCIVRNLTDEQAITQMVEDNMNQRENILPSEKAKALKMQLEAIKHQGAKDFTSGQLDPKDAGRRSNEVVAERNKMTVKQVQRYIKLNDLVPELAKMMDEGQIKFTPAVELSYIKPKNQKYIAVAIESEVAAPSLSQAQRMRELDQKGVLNGDVIDGIMMEDKKEVDKVILTGAELGKYFGKETTPREMKDQIIKLLDDWKGQQKEVAKPEKKVPEAEK